MAAQPGAFPLAVHRERHIAVRALHHLAAAAAAQKAAVTPAWHQHHRLAAAAGEGLEPLHQGAAHQAPVPLRQLLTHVHHMHGWKRSPADALRQLQQPAAGLWPFASHPGFQAWRGGSEQELGPAGFSPQRRHIPGVVAGHRAVLLVGAIVLLVQHDQPQVVEGQKHRGAGTHHQQRLALLQAASPGFDALAVAAAGVVLHHPIAKATDAAIQQLRNQADFGGQHHHGLPCLQVLGGGLQVHLGFAGSGHAPQQQLLPAAGGVDGRQSQPLVVGEGLRLLQAPAR